MYRIGSYRFIWPWCPFSFYKSAGSKFVCESVHVLSFNQGNDGVECTYWVSQNVHTGCPRMYILGVPECTYLVSQNVHTGCPRMYILGVPECTYWVSQNVHTWCPRINGISTLHDGLLRILSRTYLSRTPKGLTNAVLNWEVSSWQRYPGLRIEGVLV
jgi:hypothetical protein